MSFRGRSFIPLVLLTATLATEVAGQGPTWASPNVTPSARHMHAAAFDEGRGRMVVFGGEDGTGPLNDTWEYDGSAWIRRTPATSPPASKTSTMAYDPVRGVMWLTMGSSPDFWQWDGDTWTQAPSLPALPPDPQGLVYMRRVTWHGGTNPGMIVWQQPVSGSPGFTWRFDGSSWVSAGPYANGAGPNQAWGPAVYVPTTGMTYAKDWGLSISAAPLRAWNGSAWQTVATSSYLGSGEATSFSFAWDTSVNRLVIHSSSSSGASAGIGTSTFEFTTPLQIQHVGSTASPIPYRTASTFVHDTARNVYLVWGGRQDGGQLLYGDLWGTTIAASSASSWAPRPAATTQPTSRVYSDMAFEASTGRMVVCAGQGQSFLLNDTWTFDGSTWTNHGPSATVSQRMQPALSYAPGVGTVLFGGGTPSGTYYNDTYVLAGTQWQVPSVVGAPPARMGHDMVYAWNRLVMFGGYNGTALGDTWSLNQNGSGLSWLPMLTIGSPGARQSHAMAFDERRNCLVVFGGADANIQFLGDTWELSPFSLGWQWTQRTTANAPPRRWQHRMAYDPARGVVVLTGGYGNPQCGQFCASALNDVWEYNGSDWTLRVPSTTLPPAREGAGFAYDSQRQRFVLQGGQGNSVFPGATWFYTAGNDRFGEGMQGGSSLRLRCTRFPVAGQTTGFAFDSPYGFGWLTVFVGPAPQPGLTLGPGLLCGTGTFYGVPAAVVDAMGFPGSASFALPPSMVGQGFVTQGIALDTGMCLRLTDPLAVTIHAP